MIPMLPLRKLWVLVYLITLLWSVLCAKMDYSVLKEFITRQLPDHVWQLLDNSHSLTADEELSDGAELVLEVDLPSSLPRASLINPGVQLAFHYTSTLTGGIQTHRGSRMSNCAVTIALSLCDHTVEKWRTTGESIYKCEFASTTIAMNIVGRSYLQFGIWHYYKCLMSISRTSVVTESIEISPPERK